MPTVNGERLEVGCYVDSSHGQYAIDKACELVDSIFDIERWRTVCAAKRADAENEEGDISMDAWQALSDLHDEVVEVLDKYTIGGSWDWVDGELYLAQHDPEDDEINDFVDGYIEAMLWADCMPTEAEGPDGEYGGKTHLEVSDATRREIIEKGQLVEFVTENYDDLLEYVAARTERNEACGVGDSFWTYAGHDHLLTRGHHGAGFWDRGLGALGDRLTEASQAYGSTDDHLLWDAGDGTAVCS